MSEVAHRPGPEDEAADVGELSSALRAAADRVDATLAEALTAGELTTLETDVLRSLRATPSGMSAIVLAHRVIVSAERLERVLAGLEAAQLVRHRPDSAAGNVAVTVMGLRTLSDHERRATKLVDEILDRVLDASEQRALLRMLERLGEL